MEIKNKFNLDQKVYLVDSDGIKKVTITSFDVYVKKTIFKRKPISIEIRYSGRGRKFRFYGVSEECVFLTKKEAKKRLEEIVYVETKLDKYDLPEEFKVVKHGNKI